MVSGGLYCTSSTCGMLEGINHKILIDLCSVLHCDANVNAMWHVMLWLPLCLFQLLQVRLLSRPEAIHRCPALRDSAEERSLANVAARSSSISKVLRVFRLLSILECNINLEPKTTIYKWMFQLDDSKSLYQNCCFTKHPIINCCLGFQEQNTMKYDRTL